jgi:hypothetical protein
LIALQQFGASLDGSLSDKGFRMFASQGAKWFRRVQELFRRGILERTNLKQATGDFPSSIRGTVKFPLGFFLIAFNRL